jgi:hypothetical protein
MKDQFLGGIKDSHDQHPGSAGILIFFRWFLLKNLIDNDLINKYDRFIITRSDFIYQLPHPKVELMDENYIWIPDCEYYEGYTGRHACLSKNNIVSYLNIFNNMVLRSNEYFMKMKNKDWNLERLIKLHLEQNNVLHLVKEFPYVMYTVRNINGTTRWSAGNYSHEKGYYIKYQTEYDKSSYYKNEFEKSELKIDDFYKELIYINNFLLLGWCQGYMALKYHMEEALIEQKLDPSKADWAPKIALFSKKYYDEINELKHNKIYDFCFIGSINSNYEARLWVINFAKKYFTNNSIFINTDNNPDWELLGTFDYSNKNLGFKPKNMPNNQSKEVQYRIVKENIEYFEKMCQSKFILCPAGDAPWSFRFYEILMCKSIPIVESWHHTYRTKEESKINYKYVLYQNIENKIIYEDYINENTNIFEKYHTLN